MLKLKIMVKDIHNARKYGTFLDKMGKLRWIDIFGISLFFLILAVASFFFLRSPEYVTITVRLFERDAPDFEFNRPRQWYVENVQSGLKETDQLGRTVVEILDVYRYPSSIVKQDVFATLKVRSIYSKKTGQYTYNGLPLLVGEYRSFRLQKLLLSGVIVDIETKDKIREQKKFLVTGFLDPIDHEGRAPEEQVAVVDAVNIDGIRNFLADKIIAGLKMVDSYGEVIAEITRVNITPGKISFIQNNRYVTVNDSDRKRVEITLEVLTEKISDDYYFQKDQALIIGEKILLTFDNLNIRPTITSVTEVE